MEFVVLMKAQMPLAEYNRTLVVMTVHRHFPIQLRLVYVFLSLRDVCTVCVHA